MGKMVCVTLLCIGLVAVVPAGCGSAGPAGLGPGPGQADRQPSLATMPLQQGQRLRAVATTSIVGDVVHNIGRDLIELTVLLPRGSDPHTFEPTPQDAAALADAHVVFANGAGLERFLEPLMEGSGGLSKVVAVSRGVDLIGNGGGAGGVGQGDARQGSYDPHTWFDPNNVIVWTQNIEQALCALDPTHEPTYRENAAAYRAELGALDAWIREQVARVPQQNRRLVTDHAVFAYLARRYGFQQTGTVLPGYNTLAQPSARELAELEDTIRAQQVPAVFIGVTANPSLARQVARDTGVRLVYLYTGSLSEPAGPADTYLALMRYDISAIVEALRGR